MAKTNKVKQPGTGRGRGRGKAANEIRRLWGGLPVVDASRDLRVFILPEDTQKATRKNPGCCVFAQACKRTFQANKVLFFRRIAYVELPDETGVRRVERFSIPREMRTLIEDFDKGLDVIPEAGFLLKAVVRSDTLDEKVRQQKKSDSKRREMLLGETENTTKRKNPWKHSEPISVDLAVRSGQGAVQFNKKSKHIRE